MKVTVPLYGICLLLVSCFAPERGLATHPPGGKMPAFTVSYRHLPPDLGLANGIVLTTGQDQAGSIWLGTLENAYRFDGQRFTPLPPLSETQVTNSYIPNISSIRTDHQGTLWLLGSQNTMQQKILLLPPGQRKPLSYQQAFHTSNPFDNDNIITSYWNDGPTFRYVITQQGRILWHTGSGHFRTIGRYAPIDSQVKPISQLETKQGTLLVTAGISDHDPQCTLIEVDSVGRVLQQRRLPTLLRVFAKDTDGTIYLHYVVQRANIQKPLRLASHQLDGLIYRLSPTGQLTTMPIHFDRNPFLIPSNHTFSGVSVQFDAQRGLFWVTDMHTCFAWHPQQGVIFDLNTTTLPISQLHHFGSAFLDRTGAVWIPTDKGIVLLTLQQNPFVRYLYSPDPSAALTRHSIRGMAQFGNRLWVNTADTWWIDLATGAAKLVAPPATLRQYDLANLYPAIRSKRAELWTAKERLLRVDPSRMVIKEYIVQPPGQGNHILSIWADDQHTVWLGYLQGLSIFDIGREQHRSFTAYHQFKELSQQRVNGFFPDRQAGGIWLATSSGLYLLDTLRGIRARYRPIDRSPARLPTDHIVFVHPDPDHKQVYWLATRGGGLLRWDRHKGTYQQFTTKQGLSDNTIYAIYEDTHGRLWLPSNAGLMSFDRRTYQLHIYRQKDGIADDEFNLMAQYRAPDGRLFLGGLNGITAFYPDQVWPEKPPKASFLVTQYQKFDTQTGQMVDFYADYVAQKRLYLTARDRLVRLSFGLLDYRFLGQTRIWYRIRGWQEKWALQDDLSLQLNGLPWGDYTLDVRAQTTNGEWISDTLTIPVFIDRPFYLQTWFLLMTISVLVLGIRAFFLYRNRQLLSANARLEHEVARRTAQIEKDKAIIEKQAADLQANATLKARFFANVSHEFRTPLTLLIGPIHQLAKLTNENRGKQLLAVMERNTNQLLHLVNDLLDLSKLDARQLNLNEQPASISQVAQQVVASFLPQASYVGINLYTIGADTDYWMPLDVLKLETVLRNLLSNAIRHTAAGGTIALSLQYNTADALISITDTGQGIHHDDLPHIFDRYFQSKQTNKPLHGGTGIGLALCSEYCQLWGGQLTVSSELGKGSTFTVSYPVRPLTKPAATFTPPLTAITEQRRPIVSVSEPTAERSSLSNDSMLVLIVEDNPDMLEYIRIVLAPRYAIRTARNGREALDWLTTTKPQELPKVILSDIMMPEVDGLALLSTIRQHPLLQSIPVIMLTARADLDARLQALQLGVTDYLTKPFYEDELSVRMENLLVRAEEKSIWKQLPSTENIEPIYMTDAEWINWLQKIIQENLSDSSFTVSTLADKVNLSDRSLQRRVKVMTGLSTNQFIQEVRLQIAHELLQNQPAALVKSVVYQVGYKNLSYFTRLYKSRFGMNPGEQKMAITKT